jgi:hypothetical protein
VEILCCRVSAAKIIAKSGTTVVEMQIASAPDKKTPFIDLKGVFVFWFGKF